MTAAPTAPAQARSWLPGFLALAVIRGATTPLVVLPLAVWIFRTERMTWRRAVGLGMGFAGVLVILGVWQGVGGSALTGQLMCLGAATCYGFAIPYFKRFVGSIFTLGALGTGLAFVINTRNIRLAGASTASTVTYVIPVVATAVGLIVLDEHLEWYQPAGAAIVLAGVAISQGTYRRRLAESTPAVPDGAMVEAREPQPGPVART